MFVTFDDLTKIVANLRAYDCDTQFVEVKESAEKLPVSVLETLSAFSNGTGGTIILGLSERKRFTPVCNFNAKRIADALAQACSDKMSPPVRASIEIIEFEGAQIVVAQVEEILPRDKPCYITARGMYKGSFIRSFDGDRHLSQYEIDRLIEDKTQPSYDSELVDEATLEDLDAELYNGVIRRQRKLHTRAFQAYSDEEIAVALRIVGKGKGDQLHPTLAGLLALGVFPQKFFPRLTVTFAAYPGNDKVSDAGIKFLDSEKMVGPIPAIIADTVSAVQRNIRLGGKMNGALREDASDYPEAAVREAVCNALMHRDYSTLARGTQVQVNLYDNRLEFLSPGGLFGTVTAATVDTLGYSSTRNQHLADILESTPFKGGFVAENRGTGFKLMKRELENNGMPAPMIRDSISMFSLEFNRPTKIDIKRLPEDEIVNYMSEHEPCGAAEISENLNLPRSTVTYRLKKMVDKGIIKRTCVERSRNQSYYLA